MAMCIFVGRGVQSLLPNPPSWATRFIKEFDQQGGILVNKNPKGWSGRCTSVLLVMFLIGFVSDIVAVVCPRLNTAALTTAIPWVVDLSKSTNLFDVIARPSLSSWLRKIVQKLLLLEY